MRENDNADDLVVDQILDCCKKMSSLKKSDAISRRNTLKEIHNIILTIDSSIFAMKNLNFPLLSLLQSLISTISDESEKCRELSVATIIIIFSHLNILEETLPSLLKALAYRLGKTDERERSEEIRLSEIELLIQLIEKCNESMLPYLNDVSSILSTCIVDDYPEIKKKSCECLSLLASKEKSHFHMVAGTFLKPLLLTISHQHLKTRALCIKALACIVDYLNSDELQQAISHLAQRLFDHSSFVRLCVTEAIGTMLLTLKERYSYFYLLIPIMLSTLYDEVPEIRSKGKDLWSRIGSQYLKENETDYKDLIDFPQPEPTLYPDFEERPSLGCRILVQRNIYKIFPPLLSDLYDWVPETRVKCSKVLFSLILHSEEKITIQLTSALDGIVYCAKDDITECVDMALKSAELLGYFVDPNLLCDTVMTLIHKNPSVAHLSIFAASLCGQHRVYSNNCFQEICKFLSDPAISRLREAEKQAHLLLCIEALLSSGNSVDSDASENIFIVLSSVSGLTTNDDVFQKADSLLKRLAVIQSCSVLVLFKQYSLPFIKSLCSNNEIWNVHSPEMPIFNFIMRSGFFNEEVIELILPVFINNLHPSKDAKLRSNIISLLIPTFQNLPTSVSRGVSEEILRLIRSGVFPNLTWSAGKTASKLRTLAAASLFEILTTSSFSSTMLKSVSDELLPLLVTLAGDDEIPTRLLSCKILEVVLPQINDCVDEHKIHNTSFEILHCMEDESDDVRMMTVRVLKAYVKSFPNDYNWTRYKGHLKHMYENVLVHMDDKNDKIRQSVLNLLKDIGFTAPDVLLDEVESKRYVMAAGDLCENLIEHIKNIKV